MTHPLENLFKPRSVAIIGASADPTKRGYRAITALHKGKYEGRIVPINPREQGILGHACFADITEAPGEIDVVLICTPAATTPKMLEACGKKGVRAAVLLAGGLNEASEAGRVLEEQSVAVARRYGIRLVGPNTNGIFGARVGFNALGGYDVPRGHVAIVANSANIMGSVLDDANFFGHTGFSAALSVGNQADLSFHEYLEYFGSDPDTHVVLSYVEGFKNGGAYVKAAREVSKVKPVVVYAVGRTDEGKRAAKSHSGSLAGDYPVTRGVLEQAGVVVLTQSDHLLPVAETLACWPPMRGRRVAVLSEGGGPITIACEALTERGMVLAPLSPETQAKIHAIVPNASAINNPVDAGGGTEPRVEYYGSIATAILEDANIDALLLVGFFGGYGRRYGTNDREIAVARELAALQQQHGKPIMVQSRAALHRTDGLNELRQCGVPFHRHIEVSAQCLASAAYYAEAKARLLAPVPAVTSVVNAEAQRIIASAQSQKRHLLEHEALALLAAYGVPTPRHVLLRDAGEVEAAMAELGDVPIAVKVVSKDVLHKSDVGGVRLNVAGAAALRAAYEDITNSVRAQLPHAEITGVLATPMSARGTEVIIGVSRDPTYGPVMVFGLGGTLVEVLRDVVFRALPINADDALAMVNGLKHGAVLVGGRGVPAVNKHALCELLLAVSRIAVLHPDVAAIDLNPVIAHDSGYTVADARVLLAEII
jgi:acyl-CoA synthetase (NDP forming)